MLHCFELNITNKDSGFWLDQKLNYSIGDFKGKIKDLITDCAQKDGSTIEIYEHRDLLDNWFPESGCHIFISHSHADRNVAISIANELYSRFGIKSFIDSEFWGFVDDAIHEINTFHSKVNGRDDLLEYNKSMRVASNFYLMLSNALTDGIYNSDSCFFIKTDNSLPLQADGSEKDEGTLSPWIYTEINYTSTVALTPHPDRPKPIILEKASKNFSLEGFENYTADRAIQIAYRPKREHMVKVDEGAVITTIFGSPKTKEEDRDNNTIFNDLDKIYARFLR